MSPSTLFRRRFTRPGAAPGEFAPPEAAPAPVMHVISYDSQMLEERRVATAEEVGEIYGADREAGRVTWVDLIGLGRPELLKELGAVFSLHPLALADTVNVGQRPKADDYGDHLYFALRMVTPAGETGQWEQVSVFLGEGFVLSVQERPGDCMEPLRERVRQGRKTLRASGSDYLACMVLDSIVDGYFPVLEAFGEALEELEQRIVGQAERPDPGVLSEVYHAKRELMTFRRAAWPLRDTFSQLLRDPHELLSPMVLPYLRDTADHTMQVVDIVETYRELAASFVDVHLSSIANRTNEIMRVLTVVGSIFIPLTFFAGIYGMNFDTGHPLNMPELDWPLGYLAFWVAATLIAGAMLAMFWRLGWLGGGRRGRGG